METRSPAQAGALLLLPAAGAEPELLAAPVCAAGGEAPAAEASHTRMLLRSLSVPPVTMSSRVGCAATPRTTSVCPSSVCKSFFDCKSHRQALPSSEPETI